ncbi:3'-5' exonuclease [Thiomicrorhabdus sediminis]|uniref:3'-5' exonuclease n=1 Tax=Thiomicrorhabdus sediminis TaxID=2580412 RepID=A0A4P9K7F8_9GAMM|nr:3'-5' exonuclease [Thiomicrorhabdus sediminis]QCU90276.1 3'-5' exonuclease [Thiomicrorhabdus sediminis]
MFNTIKSWLNERRLNQQKAALKDDAYAYLFEPAQAGCFVCFDCETTGLDRNNDRIITLSAVKIVGDEILTSQGLNLVVKQEQEIAEQSILVHQIRNIDVEDSKSAYATEQDAIKAFLAFIRGATLVGYYLEFDVAMVNRVIKPWLGIELPNPKIEVSELYYLYARREAKRSCIEPNIDLRFDSILKHLQLPNFGQHDAANDALMTALIFVKLQKMGLR